MASVLRWNGITKTETRRNEKVESVEFTSVTSPGASQTGIESSGVNRFIRSIPRVRVHIAPGPAPVSM